MGLLLGIDVGTSSVRAMLIRPEGEVLAVGQRPYPLAYPRPGWVEQDPEGWWDAACACIRSVLARMPSRSEGVSGVGWAGQMHGLVLLDQRGVPLRPAIIWPDGRTAAQVETFGRLVGTERAYALTGVPIATGLFALSLMWVKEHEPDTYNQARVALLPKDYVRYRLTGDIHTDETDASGTLLFDVGTRRWSDEVVERAELRREVLPPCAPAEAIAGAVSAEGSRRSGLPAGVPVAVGGADQMMGALALGITAPGRAASVIGTGGQLFTAVRRPVIDPGRRLHTFCHAIPGTWLLMGAILAGGLSLQWLGEAISGGRHTPHDDFRVAHEVLSREAGEVPAGADGLMFMPHLVGERTPHMDSTARGAFVGLRVSHGRAHLARAVMEGVVFGMRESLAIFRELGVPVDSVVCSGGGARSSAWRQIQADIYGLPVEVPREAEHSAYGAALLAGIATGLYRGFDEAFAFRVPVESVVEPDPQRAEVYASRFELYRRLYPLLRSTFAALS